MEGAGNSVRQACVYLNLQMGQTDGETCIILFMILVLPIVKILVHVLYSGGIIPSPYVCTSFGFVVSDKVKSRGKGYLSIFFRPAVPLPQNDYRYLSSSDARLSRDFGIC